MKVAKDWERFPIAMLGRLAPVVRSKLKEGLRPQASKARYMCAAGRNLRFGKLYLVDYSLNWRNDSGYVNRG